MSLDSIKKKLTLTEPQFFVLAMAAYLLLGIFKLRTCLLSGRFWAEEGRDFYTHISASGARGLLFLFNGHLELITNAVVVISTWLPLRWAPLSTMYTSLLLQSLPIMLLLRYRETFLLGRLATLGVVVLAAGMPQASEVWANSINLHFHFAILTALIAALPIAEQRNKWLFRALLLGAGLSGIPANFLVPLFYVQALCESNRERWIQSAILSVCCITQLTLIATHGVGDRQPSFNLLNYLLAFLAQHEFALIFFEKKSLRVAKHLQQILQGDMQGLAFVVLGGSLFATFFYRAWRNSKPTQMLLIAALALSVLSFTTALGNKQQLISSMAGGRYFYASNLLFSIALFSLASMRRHYMAVIACGVIALNTAVGAARYFDGPDWREQYAYAIAQDLDSVGIWPAGWRMKLPHR